MDFIKGLYTEGLVEGQLDEGAIERIQQRVEARELLYYRLIVGTENLMKARLFVEMATNGKSVPAPVVEGYLPAIEMLNDIVRAGPTYIEQLKSVHKRAKKTL